MNTFESFSSSKTKQLGFWLARSLRPGRKATMVALVGELGSGKTTFVQGFFRGLGLKRRAQSPTFILMRRISLSRGKFNNVFHVDAYRLQARDLKILNLKEILRQPGNLLLIEWAERLPKLPKNAINVKFQHGKRENERVIRISK